VDKQSLYFSTVDNEVFGGGSKITHNITVSLLWCKAMEETKNGAPSAIGDGVRQRNVSSATTIICSAIQAPVSRVSDILLRNEHLKIY
jgi:uncharacterized protein YbcC (UPF0753/DUF2309 family)